MLKVDYMKEFLCAIVIVLAIAIFVMKVHSFISDDRIYVKASDGKKYKVRNTIKKQETAEALARLNSKVSEFIQRLVNDADIDHKAMALRLQKRWNPDTVAEGRIDKRYTSYTVNKGEQVVLCLRTRDEKDEMYDDNLIFYVTLHEMGHIASVSEDHSPEFHANFRYLLKKASEWNYWTRVSKPFHYCGMKVNGM